MKYYQTFTLSTCGGVKVFCKGLTGLGLFVHVIPLKDTISFNPANALDVIKSVNKSIDFIEEIRFFLDDEEIRLFYVQ